MGTFTGFIIFAFSSNLTMLFISRAIDGIFGGTLPVAKAMIGDAVKPRDRSIQMTNIGVCHNISNLFGPALGGILSKNFGLLGPGLVASSLSFFTIIQISIFLKESAPNKVGKIIWEEIEKERSEKNRSEKNTNNSNEPLSLFKNRTAIILLIQWGLHSIAFTSIIAGLPLFAYTKFLIDEQEIGFIFSIAGVFQLFIRYTFFYPMLKKIGDFKTGEIGLSLFVFSYFIMGFAAAPYQLILIMLLNSYAASCTRGVLQGFMSRAVHPKILGKVMGIHSGIENIAQIIGPIMITSILTFWNVNLFGITSSILSLFALLMIFLRLEFKYEKNEAIKEE